MYFKYKDRLKVIGWMAKMYHANSIHKKTGMDILITNTADFNTLQEIKGDMSE